MSEHSSESDLDMLESSDDRQPSARDIEIANITRDFAAYTVDANFCIYFKIVHNRQEVEDDIKNEVFHPDFVHQFFGTTERIFGYKNPIIKFFYSPSRLKRYFKFEYQEKICKEKQGIEADDVIDCLSPVLDGIEYTQDLNQFIKDLESEDEKIFQPCGQVIGSFTSIYKKPNMMSRAQLECLQAQGDDTGSNGQASGQMSQSTEVTDHSNPTDHDPKNSHEILPKKTYYIYHANHQTKGFDKIQANVQSLIMWFIESATMIDHTDPRWDFFLVYEKFNPNSESQSVAVSTDDRYYFCGYATVYRYFAYPDKIRPRISQTLILPHYKRNGIGTALLDAIYNFYRLNKATLDITVEDPDEEFIVMRDFLDCKNCLKLKSYQPEKLMQGWSKEMFTEAQENLKLCQRQARKVYEILKLKSINMEDEVAFTAYRLEIKNRLNVPNQRMKLDCDKIVKRGFELPDDLKKQKDNLKLNLAQLEENFRELLKQYEHTIAKLNKLGDK